MTTIRAIDPRPYFDRQPIERAIEQRTTEAARAPSEAETVAHIAADGVNMAGAVKNNIERMIERAEEEFEALKKEALALMADVADRQAKLQERIAAFTDNCGMLKTGMTDVYKKLSERAGTQ